MINKKQIFVIIPCFNEGEIIRQTILDVSEKGFTAVVVDDASEDDTAKQVKDLPVIYLKHQFNLGQGAALQTGIDVAMSMGAEYIVSFDADGQHDVEDILKLCEKAENENLDVVMGSRFLPGASTNIKSTRKYFLKMAAVMNFLFTGVLLTDAHNGIRVFSRKATGQLRIRENRMAHATEILMQIKKYDLQFAEYPVHIKYTEYSRKKGQSLLNSIRIFFELVLNKLFDK